MSERSDAAAELIIRQMDLTAHPDVMSQEEAADFYEQVESHADAAAVALREEMGNEG